MSQSFEWVADDKRLAELCLQWQQQAAIALDTEFIRTRTFFPIIGLLQVADSLGIYLVDPLAVNDLQPLRDVLQNVQVVKVIHACSEDLEVFHRFLGVLPTPLFDTQIAAAFAGYGSSIGYAGLVAAVQGDSIPKHETRSDWLQRPLSQSQLSYAALDVEHLLAIYNILVTQLVAQQRLSWVESDCQRLLDHFSQTDNFDQYYLRLKSAWKLKPYQLAVLQTLCAWREQAARDVDIPRSHLIKDSSLLDMALRLPTTTKQLQTLSDMHHRFVEKHGEHCLQLIESSQQASQYPQPLPGPLDPEQTRLFKQLKAQVVAIADTLHIPPEFLARKKELESLVIATTQAEIVELPAALQDWRKPVVGDVLLAFLGSHNQSEITS
jgi:ribonuclease D